jgi:hypothetical protein
MLADADVRSGVEGTMEKATAWTTKPAADSSSDPSGGTAALNGAALLQLWTQLEASGWRQAKEGSATLIVVHGTEDQTVTLEEGPALAAVRHVFETATDKLEPLTGVTELLPPQRLRASTAAQTCDCKDEGGAVQCKHGDTVRMCFPASSPGLLSCFDEPGAKTGVVVRSNQRVVLPVRYALAWSAEAPGGLECRAGADDVTVLSCTGGRQLGAVLPGRSRWIAHAVVGTALGPPVVLRRVFPASGQLGWGEKLAPVGAFQITLDPGDGLERLAIAGDLKSAKAWRFNPAGTAAPYHHGTLAAADIKALWAKLNALHWDDAGPAPAPRLVISAAGVEGAVATPAAIEAVRNALRKLPAATWKTRVTVPAVPSSAGKAVAGHCAQNLCRKASDKHVRRCLPTKSAKAFYCLTSPWETKGVALNLDHADFQARPSEVWGLELDSGDKCELDEHNEMVCKGGARLAELSQDGDAWFALITGKDGAAVGHSVKTAWLTGPREK